MTLYVTKDTIDDRVVKHWSKIFLQTAQERGENTWTIQPFFPYSQTYSEIREEVKKRTHQGHRFYLSMVHELKLLGVDIDFQEQLYLPGLDPAL